MASNLRSLGKRLVSDMIEKAKSSNPWKVLILDDYSLKILSTATKFFDLTEEKISVIEKLSLKRKPLKEMDAIYIVTPSESSVNSIIRDFDGSNRLYHACHLFFLTTLPEELFQKISSSPVAKYIKTFVESNYDFFVCESQIFLTDIMDPKSPNPAFPRLYTVNKATLKQELSRIGKQVATLCASLKEFPYIRFDNSGFRTENGLLTELLAKQIREEFDNISRLDASVIADDRPRAHLLVLDRTFDFVTPLVHEFTYQAMINDLLDVDEFAYSYDSTDATGKAMKKTATLNEDDEKWREYRHSHIAECITKIVEEFNKFVKDNEALRGSKNDGKPKSIKDVSALIRAAPQYSEQLSKFSTHLTLTQEAMKKYTENKIEDLARVEQSLATRETEDGEKYKGPQISELANLLNAGFRSENDKLRLVMLYILWKGDISKEDKAALYNQVNLSEQDRRVADLIQQLKIRPEIEKKKDDKKKEPLAYELSRYNPKLKRLLENLIDGSLSTDDFPYFKDQPPEEADGTRSRGVSVRTAKSNWAKGQKKEDSSNKGPRIIVFIAGGITHSEMRTIYQINSNDVFLGSDQVIKPREFLQNLRSITSGAR